MPESLELTPCRDEKDLTLLRRLTRRESRMGTRFRCILRLARNENAGEAVTLRRISRGILPLAAERDGARPRRSTSPGPSLCQGRTPARMLPRHARRRKTKRVKRERLAASIVIARQNGADMPQFFFNLTNGETVRDERGTACDTVENAKAYALAVAAELGRNRSPEELHTLAVCVTDETGQEVFKTRLVNMQHPGNADAITRAARNQES